MDNLGDWIYIVFLIIAAVSGLFSSKNKKKRPTQVLGQPGHDTFPEENTSSGKGFWEILEEVKNVSPQQPAPVKATSGKKNLKKEAQTPKAFLSAEKEIHQSKVSTSRPMAFPYEEEHTMLEDIEFNNIEELRKAVIYSEILNRKY
ncbi:hypothetical protein DWX23_17795 [Parabacteroides sp. AF18-52]|jgi:hypothetical protein|uniref:hypothetical protein n=1 Tax=Parabacteroides TaxID=375288 RepID=UPI000EFEFD72|nr:hypothetical protein [Parabacteroides sp. AF18-52]RHR37720.1 hypothetical protein DWX23_17795 [Parabacteroides sp. AF18-52]